MSSQQNSPTTRLRARAAAGLLAFLCAGALSAAGPAAAASQPSGALHPAVAPGTISTIAGGIGGPAKATNVAVAPVGLALSGGHIYIAGGGAVRDVTPSGQLTSPAGSRDAPASFGGPAAASGLNDSAVAKDHNGNLVIADKHHVAVVAARNGTFYGQPMKAGNIYSVAGNGQRAEPANGAVARHAPLGGGSYGVTVDSNGNLVISDSGFRDSLTRNRFGALVEVVATSSGTFYGQKMIAGHIYTVAGSVTGTKYTGDGGPATKAGLGMYQGTVRIDQAGNLILADTYSSTVRVVAEQTGTFYGVPMKTGDIYTVAGTGFRGFSGDGGPAIQAELFGPFGAAPDVAGNLVIADTGNARIRVVAGRTGTFYGQQMTVGHIGPYDKSSTAGLGRRLVIEHTAQL